MFNIPSGLAAKKAMLLLKAKKNSPTILFASGVAGVTCSTVMACKATLKLQTTLDKASNDIDQLKIANHDQPDLLPDEQLRKDIAIVYVRTVKELGKAYAPAIIVGLASVGALTKAHSILNERNAALVAAYSALDETFSRYRERVVDKYGEDEDRQFRYASEEYTDTDEKGKSRTSTRHNPDEAPGLYARYFDEYSRNWSRDPEINLVFLRNQQNRANDLLKIRKFLTLNEVYQMLDIPQTDYGMLVGWVFGPDGKDGYIDFGCFTGNNSGVVDFMNGRNGSVLLDFNVDGYIYDNVSKLPTREAITWQG